MKINGNVVITTLLNSFSKGEVVKLNQKISGDTPLWTVGEYGSTTPLKNYRTPMINWEIFSESCYSDGFQAKTDPGNDINCDNGAMKVILDNMVDTNNNGNWDKKMRLFLFTKTYKSKIC